MYKTYGCRWSSIHSVSGVGDQDVIVMVTKSLTGGGTGYGPYQVTLVNAVIGDGYDICGHLAERRTEYGRAVQRECG